MMADPSGSGAGNYRHVKEYVIRAAPKTPGSAAFLGRFPLGVPDLASTSKWSMKKDSNDGSTGNPAWLLEDKPGHVVHRGTIGDLSDNVGYFVLATAGPSVLTAVPVTKWYNFRPVVQHEVPSLEDAEELMKRGKRPHVAKSISDRLNRAAPESSDPALDAGTERKPDSDDSEFDEEREYRPKKKKALNSSAKGSKVDKNEALSSPDDAPGPEESETWKPVGVEDWEYEEDVADDDMNMGEVDEDDEVEEEMRKYVGSPSSEEDQEEEQESELVESVKHLKKLLKKNEMDSESDKDDDIDDLDEMAKGASEILERASISQANKRKMEAALESKDKFAKDKEAPKDPIDTQKTAKKPKHSHPPKATKAKEDKTLTDGPKSIETQEIVNFLRSRGPMPLEELISAFKKIISGKEDHQKFIGRVKKLAIFMEYPEKSGKKAVVLKKFKEK